MIFSIRNLEQKYQEQLKSLQAELDVERELVVSTSVRQQAQMEAEVQRLKEEDAILRERYNNSSKVQQ